MASTVLPNGIIIPEKYSRDWYNDLYHNWQELDNLLGGGGGGANDGTLTIQKNGTTVGTFSANQATDETINIEVPDVNNGTLTIQQNGTDVTTFSANASTNATANITVPTKTSDLTNDSGFITEDTTKIPLAGSNAISGDLIPSTDGTVNLGSSSKKFASLNGIAPDELGLPASTYTDVSSYITHFDSTANTFTAPVSGLLFLDGANENHIQCLFINNTKGYIMNVAYTYNSVRGLFPVEKGDSITVYINRSIAIGAAKIYHLKGKV